jgi:predicted HTH transcriptional regulator
VRYLHQPEGKTLEFKRDLSSTRNILKTLVAFANTAGGTLLVGAEDKTGRC